MGCNDTQSNHWPLLIRIEMCVMIDVRISYKNGRPDWLLPVSSRWKSALNSADTLHNRSQKLLAEA
eukprot:scaffold395710_cov35-Prasinocladus_malaysianus.AAC.1